MGYIFNVLFVILFISTIQTFGSIPQSWNVANKHVNGIIPHALLPYWTVISRFEKGVLHQKRIQTDRYLGILLTFGCKESAACSIQIDLVLDDLGSPNVTPVHVVHYQYL